MADLKSVPKPLTDLPEYIFLLSDHTTLPLACGVARELCQRYNVMLEDFRTPVLDAFNVLTGLNAWDADLGDPTNLTPTQTDQINSLLNWHADTFGEAALGAAALIEAAQKLTSTTVVFRDATWTHITPFLNYIKPHQGLVVNLPGQVVTDAKTALTMRGWGARYLIPNSINAAAIVAAIESAA